MSTRVEIFCRRCRQSLGLVESGRLVSCINCRGIVTRATLAFCLPPSMVITVEEAAPWGYRVKIGRGPRFEEILGALKSSLPARQRHYGAGVWFIHARGRRRFDQWLASVRQLGAEVIDSRGQINSMVA